MIPPLICFLCFDRLCLTVRNLTCLLNTSDDFELYIVDSNSTDGTFDYLKTLTDPRIKEIKHFDANRWCVYASNYVLSHRKPGQYFLYIENDIQIHTPNFLKKLMTVMDSFPDVGLLGCLYDGWLDTAKKIENFKTELITKNSVSYNKVTLIAGCCNFYRPELLDILGYSCEETFGADVENCLRINEFTKFHIGLMLPSDIKITIEQVLFCNDCLLKNSCKYYKNENTYPKCITDYLPRHDRVSKFNEMQARKRLLYLNELYTGKRTVYCASIHDPESQKSHYYNKEWAEENFDFFINEIDSE